MKKLLAVILSIACVLACVFGLAACGETDKPSGDSHTHAYKQRHDDTEHWLQCDISGCTEKIKNRAAHDTNGTDRACSVCGYKAGGAVNPPTPPTHSHVWSQSWESNETHHWHDCTADGCPVTDNSLKDGYAKHDFGNGNCVCGKIKSTEGLEYILNDDGESYSVTGIGTATDTALVIPAEYNGKPVTSIGYRAFKEHSSLTSVIIPDSLKIIGIDAFFNCSSLTSVTIGKSVTSIGEYAFYGCHAIERISYTGDIASWCGINGVYYLAISKVYIGNQKLQEMTDIIIPDGVTSISSGAFYTCSNLANITIPDSVTKIGMDAFKGCGALERINYTGDIASWCGITGIYYLYTSKVYIGNQKLQEMTDIIIPNSVTSIGEYAFWGCSSLTSITIPDSVTSIGDYAFRACSSLTSITIPDSVTSIGRSAFEKCDALERINYTGDIASWCGISGVRYLIGEVYIGNQKLQEMTDIIIPNSVTSIGEYAFENCSNLTSVTIPGNVTNIGEFAFFNCSSLTSVTIGNGVTSIGGAAFGGCNSLTSVIIPDSIMNVGSEAFYECNSLQYNEYENAYYLGNSTNPYVVLIKAKDENITSCTIHENTRFIYDSAFNGCKNLQYNEYENAYYLGNNTNPYVVLIKAKDESITSCTIHENTKFIYFNAFIGCGSLTNITVPDSVTSIGGFAFRNCSRLGRITIGNGVTSIGYSAFYDCRRLIGITFNGTIEQWNAIEKGSDWNNYADCPIHCTDGDIAK